MFAAVGRLLTRVRDEEAGEGVISAGIAILIVALLGAAMYGIFSVAFDDVTEGACEELKLGDTPVDCTG